MSRIWCKETIHGASWVLLSHLLKPDDVLQAAVFNKHPLRAIYMLDSLLISRSRVIQQCPWIQES